MTATLDEYFMRIYESALKGLENSEQFIKDYPNAISSEIECREYNMNTVAMIDFCYKKDFVNGKKYFYAATLCREWFFEEFPKGRYKIDEYRVAIGEYKSLYSAILSGNEQRAVHMAKLFGRYPEVDKDEHPANKLVGYSLKYVILDDVQNADEWLNQLEQVKDKRGMKQLYNGHGIAMRGLIHRNEEEFNAGLLTMLKNHVGRMKKQGWTLEQYFAYDSVALAMLARNRGMNVTVKHDLLPEEYFTESDINYDEIKMM